MAEPDDKQTPPPSDGVFGNLPSTRPGTRSPRRAKAGDEKGSNGSSTAARPRSKSPPPPPPPRRTAAPPPPPRPAAAEESSGAETAPPADPGQRIGGIEDLAWAGIAVAAQAATVGVKAASRAMDAMRKSLDGP